MKKVSLLLIFWIPFILLSQPCKEVVGYYAGWQWYDRNHVMNPQSVPYEKYTVLTYAFMLPQADGSIRISDPWGDKNQLLGPINWATAPAGYDTQYDFGNGAYHIAGQKLSDYAHQDGCKLLVSIGGWTYSTHFPSIAADPIKRAQFAHDCNNMVHIYGLDGIDLDWEYPATNTEKQNFTFLLQQIRDSLTSIESLVNRDLMLTIAVGANPNNMLYVDWNNVIPIVDFVNLMSYDFFGSWDNTTNHNAPLFSSSCNPTNGFSCSEAVSNILNQGVSPDKINMGIAWYGRSQMTIGVPNLCIAGTGQGDMGHFSLDDGTPLYYRILMNMDQFDYHWDSISEVPYLTGKTTNSFVSFDDVNSIEKKAQYINSMHLRGAIIWEISGDYIESNTVPGTIGSTPLTDILNTTFCNDDSGIELNKTKLLFQLYPNPVNTNLIIKVNNNESTDLTIFIYDIFGNLLISKNKNSIDCELIDVTYLKNGIYFIKVVSQQGQSVQKFIKQ